MSVNETMVIDFITEKDNNVILTISDHLEWDDKQDHILLLQEKIKTYLMAIESGQVYEKYPLSIGKNFVISVALKFEPHKDGLLFLSHVKNILLNDGYGFDYYIFKPKKPYNKQPTR